MPPALGEGSGATLPSPVPAAQPDRPVLMADRSGAERWTSEQEAIASGHTIVDLSDDWTPLLFAEHQNEAGEVMHNRYRRVFIGLANDQLDEDGQPLAPGEKNYLELYGIFPSLSVLRKRFLDDGARTCHDSTALAALDAVETVSYIAPSRVRAEERRLALVKKELDRARRAARVQTLAELAEKNPKLAAKVKLVETRTAEQQAFAEVERRLACEGFLGPKSKHQAGVYDDVMKQAVRRFQQKHMIYEAHYLRRDTMDALARAPLENDLRSLLRALRERVVAATGIIEDGSSFGKAPPTYGAEGGVREPMRNLADEYTKIVAEQLGLDTVEGATAFFKRQAEGRFASLRVAVKVPAPPPYYGPDMDLSIVIDRGDIWYDLPFDETTGAAVPQPRKKYPQFTLYVRHNGQRLPLVRWRTTVGGWRSEQAADGYEYYRYKGSDVGPRVIRQIVAGPVWIAPASTPIRSLVKGKKIGRGFQRVVNYSELGPGYTSAYGLVAGYFVVPGKDGRPDWDNGIRAHGSAEYLSMFSPNGFSHGCHRLPNHLAIRLYSFILRHRPMRVVGDQPMDFSRQFLRGDEVFELRIPSRGYAYQLEPPVPVEVLEGEIKGKVKEPIAAYVPKPGVRYPGPPPPLPNSPEARAGGGSGGGAPGLGRGASGRRTTAADADGEGEEAQP